MFVFGKLGVLCFLETPVLRFALLPYYRRFRNVNLELIRDIHWCLRKNVFEIEINKCENSFDDCDNEVNFYETSILKVSAL